MLLLWFKGLECASTNGASVNLTKILWTVSNSMRISFSGGADPPIHHYADW
jgi:hypothetical protein